ncbi:histidine biosynthesis trifunctional-protein [Zopfochytrium polystomum]|nr:histidine biosynthesis trifunctional-protein [Zopfochytrium polystomum]
MLVVSTADPLDTSFDDYGIVVDAFLYHGPPAAPALKPRFDRCNVLVQVDPLEHFVASSSSDTLVDTYTAQLVSTLDAGASKVVVPVGAFSPSNDQRSLLSASLSKLPSDRLALRFEVSGNDATDILGDFSNVVDTFVVSLKKGASESEESYMSLLKDLSVTYLQANKRLLVELPAATSAVVALFDKLGVDVVVPTSRLSSGDDSKLDVADAFVKCLNSDRPDGLFPTVVVDEQGVSLGLAYSSAKSISETIRLRQGVYQSRSRGLWYKGQTSGATQEVVKIKVDCDKDTIQFVVAQKSPGFCHLNTRTCFGSDSGITALMDLLQARKIESPPGSYTRRLFDDSTLLRAKILEEANELCDATDKDDIAWETADLIYFALVKCAANGVSLADVEKHLDRRSKKVTRRPGNAKPPFQQESATKPPAPVTQIQSAAKEAEAKPAPPEIKMKSYSLSALTPSDHAALLKRPIIDSKDIQARVLPIIQDLENRGDAALRDFTAKFDGVKLDAVVIKAPFDPSLTAGIPSSVREAIDKAYENILAFHAAQLEQAPLVVETMPGVTCSRFVRPIERVGLYVPGGTAVLPSTSLMLGIPAKVAGCSEIVIASPPRKDGSPVPEVVYVAEKVGASTILLAGGAQAVAAMAFGTESVPKVDKIAGPGNQYVTAAKMILQNDSRAMISIDMPAGPSELLVIADENSNPAYVASDLLSQAEHGGDSQVVLVAVAVSAGHLAAIEREVKVQGEALPRADIVRVSIPKSYILNVQTRDEALAFSNAYAPEHLILHIDDAEMVLPKVVNAGSVFVGKWSPESCGDYASGTNHTLPTYGYARMYSGVNTHTFVKHITAQTLTKDGLNRLGDVVTTLAEIEGLEAHRNAVALRLKDIRSLQ